MSSTRDSDCSVMMSRVPVVFVRPAPRCPALTLPSFDIQELADPCSPLVGQRLPVDQDQGGHVVLCDHGAGDDGLARSWWGDQGGASLDERRRRWLLTCRGQGQLLSGGDDALLSRGPRLHARRRRGRLIFGLCVIRRFNQETSWQCGVTIRLRSIAVSDSLGNARTCVSCSMI